MTTTMDGDQRSGSADRRLLPRDDLGRRRDDLAGSGILSEEEESALRLKRLSLHYVLMFAAVLMVSVVTVSTGNHKYAPMLHDTQRISEAAEVLSEGRAYLTYDLNIETRQLREEHIKSLKRTPELAVMGASHWQEGHEVIAPGVDYYNAHIHRDYYEDIVGVVGSFYEAGRLPETLVISIRDNQFLPVSARTDFLWTPGLEAYRRMARRLGLPHHVAYAHGLTPQLRQELSLPLLAANLERDFASPVKPGPRPADAATAPHPTLSTLLPDGSILWSVIQEQSYTQERTRRLSLEFAAEKRHQQLVVDPLGLRSVDRVLAFLAERGVKVYLAHPPFNPTYWAAVQGSPYMEGLKNIERITQDLAAKYGWKVVGSFNPHDLGCVDEMYIDAEHSGPECLKRIIDQVLEDQNKLARNAPTGERSNDVFFL
ncbi:MAG: hypothetical protein KTR21_02640 [Rhodobacteraceae bacterium]|nr:hypothetical protein [Paracoccaceae bacterium]